MNKTLLLVLSTLVLSVFLLPLTSTPVFAQPDPMAHWKLNEATAGTTVKDSSVNGFHGTPINNPAPSTFVSSDIPFADPYSLRFNGSNWVEVDDGPAFAMTSATFSVWVKFNSLPTNIEQDMLAKRTLIGDNVQWQFGYSGHHDTFKITLANNDEEVEGNCCTDFYWAPSEGIDTDTWYNVAVVINGNKDTITWYLNGVKQHKESIGDAFLGQRIPTAPLTIGASYSGDDEHLLGYLDDVRIYNTALTDKEVAAIGRSRLATDDTPSSCSSSTPVGTDDLFQIDATSTQATLFYTPASGNSTDYYISYGLAPNDERFGTFTHQGHSSGVLSFSINDLAPNTTYYMKVRPLNICSPGEWSNEMKIITPNGGGGIRYYKDFLSQVFSGFN